MGAMLRDEARWESSQSNGNVVLIDPDGRVGGIGIEMPSSLGFTRRAMWPQDPALQSDFFEMLTEDFDPDLIAIDEPAKWFSSDVLDKLVSRLPTVRIVCTVRGELRDLAGDHSFIRHFKSAIVLAQGCFDKVEVALDLYGALKSIEHRQPYELETRKQHDGCDSGTGLEHF